MTYTITIPACPPSLNKTLRMHWAARKKLSECWKLQILCVLPRPLLKPIVKVRCTITLHHSRPYDKDNAYGACKVVVDALRHYKAIFDDTKEYLELTVEQAKCPHKQRHTVIEIGPALAVDEAHAHVRENGRELAR